MTLDQEIELMKMRSQRVAELASLMMGDEKKPIIDDNDSIGGEEMKRSIETI